MKRVKVHEAKTNFSKILRAVEGGEEVVVQRGDVPVAKIVPIPKRAHRKPGLLKGQIWIADDFDETPEEFAEYV